MTCSLRRRSLAGPFPNSYCGSVLEALHYGGHVVQSGHAGIEAQSASNGVHSFAVRRASIPAVYWIDLGQFELHYFTFSRTVIGSPERSSHMS